MFQVAELVATLRLDKGQFDGGLRESGSQLEGLGSKAASTGSSLAGALTNGMRAAAVTTVALGAAAAATLKSLLSTGIAYNTLQQTSRAALTTLLGGAKEANAQMDKLDAFAKTSPFSKSVFITAQQQLIGFGMAAEKVVPTLGAIQNAVAAVGGSNEDIASITMVLAQIQSAGKITGEDLMQLAGRGINAAELIGKAMGKTGPEIKDAITKGTIGGQEALDALVTQMDIKFAGAAANVKNTMTGASDRVKSATRDIGAALAEPFVSKNGGGRLVQWSNDWADALRALEKKVPSVVSLMTDRLSPAMTRVSVVIGDAKEAIRGFDVSRIGDGLDKLASNLPAVSAVTGAILGLTSGALAGIPVIGSLVGGLNPLAAALIGVVVATPELRSALGEVFGAMAPLLPAVASLAGALSGALTSAAVAASPLLEGLATVVGVVARALVPVIGAVESVADAFSGLPPEVQTMIVAFGLFMAIRQPVVGVLSDIGEGAKDLVVKLKEGGLKGAVSGVLSVFGGPWGLALGAATAILGHFAAEQSETKSRLDDFTASLDQNTGAVTKNTAVIAGKKLMEYSDTFKQIKLNVKDASDAVANGGPAYLAMVQKIDKLRQATLEYQTTNGNAAAHQNAREALIKLAESYDISADKATSLNTGALSQLLQGMAGLRGEVIDTSEGWKTLNAATETTEPTTLRLADAIKKVGDDAANTNDRLAAYRDIVDAMNGKTKSAEEAQRDLAKSSRTLAGFLGEVDGAGNRVNASMAIAADGTVQFNDAGDRLMSMLEPLRDRGMAAAVAASDLAKAQGRNAAAAAEADQALQPYRDTLQRLADQGLLSQQQVDALSKSLFGVPGETTAVISDGNSAAAVKVKVDELTGAIKATPNKEIVITEPLSPAIMEKLKVLGYTVVTLPNGNIKVTETGTDATGQKIDSTAGKKRWAMIDVDAPSASAVELTLNNLARRREAMIAVVYSDPGAPTHGGPRRAVNDGYDVGNANGNLLEFYANGGMRHPRLSPMSPLAQIVPPNTWRVVGDNMKVPELYAPLDGSQRSLALLREGVERSGFDMVPKGTRFFAEGGFHGSSAAPIPAPERQVHRIEAPGPRPAPVYQFTGPVTVTNQAEFEAMSRQRAADRNAALGIPAIERQL